MTPAITARHHAPPRNGLIANMHAVKAKTRIDLMIMLALYHRDEE